VFVFRQFFSRLIRFVKGKSHILRYYHEEKAKNEFALKKVAYTYSPVSHKSMACWYFDVFIFSNDFELHA